MMRIAICQLIITYMELIRVLAPGVPGEKEGEGLLLSFKKNFFSRFRVQPEEIQNFLYHISLYDHFFRCPPKSTSPIPLMQVYLILYCAAIFHIYIYHTYSLVKNCSTILYWLCLDNFKLLISFQLATKSY